MGLGLKMDIELICRFCFISFHICGKCFRGNVYCSDICRCGARKLQLCEAERRYRTSTKGRINHNSRQKHFRNKENPKSESTVTHHSSAEGPDVLQTNKIHSGRCVCCGAQIKTFVRGVHEYFKATRNFWRVNKTASNPNSFDESFEAD